MNTELDRIGQVLVEVEGGCWHVPDINNVDECVICQCAFQRPDYEPFDCSTANPNFSQWENFGRLLKIADKLKQNLLIQAIGVYQDIEMVTWMVGNHKDMAKIDHVPELVATELAKIITLNQERPTR